MDVFHRLNNYQRKQCWCIKKNIPPENLRHIWIYPLKIKFWAKTVWSIPAGIYLLKVNNRNTRIRCEIYYQNDAISLVLVSLLLTLNIFHTLLWYFYFNFEHVIADWDVVWSFQKCPKIIHSGVEGRTNIGKQRKILSIIYDRSFSQKLSTTKSC